MTPRSARWTLPLRAILGLGLLSLGCQGEADAIPSASRLVVLPDHEPWTPRPRGVYTCEPQSAEDPCTTCARTECCDAMTACTTPRCQTAFEEYVACLTAGDGFSRSGFSRQYCAAAAEIVAAGAEDLAACAESRCSTASTCGSEPPTAFAPAPSGTGFSAATFLESYCTGCHQPAYSSPGGRPVSLLSTDPAWTRPYGSADWLDRLDRAVTRKRGTAIRCGVHPGFLPADCADAVRPGFFGKPEKFPPSGDLASASYGATPPPFCAFAPDGHSCAQPTLYERARMVSWIDAGMPD